MSGANAIGLSLLVPLSLSGEQKDQTRKNLDIASGASWTNNSAVATSGTVANIDFPVPSGVRTVDMCFLGVVHSTAAPTRAIALLTRDGTGALVSTATYNCTTGGFGGSTTNCFYVSNAVYVTPNNSTATGLLWGKVRFDRVGANFWTVSGVISNSLANVVCMQLAVGGGISLSDELAALRLVSSSGSYSGGSVAVNWTS